ncbi:MAG: molybdopterin biosynthesis enzyme MoaB [Myxococcota bacterium]|jgi:molybdopterin biosynthesis enzyme MoaB
MHILMISDSRTDTATACAEALKAALNGTVEWLPDERRFIDAALTRLTASSGGTGIVLCGGDVLGPSAHLDAAVTAAITAPLPGFGEALRRALEPTIGPRALLIHAPAGSTGSTRIVTLPLSLPAVNAGLTLLGAISETWRRRLAGEVLAELPAAEAPEGEPAAAPAATPAAATPTAPDGPPVIEAEFEDVAEDVPEGITLSAMPDASAPRELEQLASGWRAGLRAIGGRLDGEVWAEIPEDLARVAAAREILESAGQRATVAFPDGRTMAAFGFPDLTRDGSKVLLVGEGAPVAEVIALHRHPRLAGLTIWGSRGLLPSADADGMALAEERLGRAPPTDGELFAIDHDAIYFSRSGAIHRWDGRSQDREGTESQTIASLMLRWSQR